MDIRTNTATRITVGPFFDKTDGVTPEVALTVTAEKLTLMCDVAGVPTLILDTAPTASGGANDMVLVAGNDAGYYDLELAAANVNYMGRAKIAITDAATHCPVFHDLNLISAEEYDRKYGDATFLGIKEYGVPTAATANTVTLQGGRTFGTNTLSGNTLLIKGATQGYWQEMQILSNTNADPCVLTVTDNFPVTPSGVLASKIFGTTAGSTANPPLVKLAPITHTSAVIPTVSAVSGAVGSVTGAVGSVTGSVGSVTGAVGSVTGSVASVAGAVGSVTGNVGGNVVGSVASVTGFTAANIGTIMAVTTKLDGGLELNAGFYRYTPAALVNAPSGTGASAASIRAEMDANSTKLISIQGVTAKLDTAVELDGVVYRYTVNSLEQAPSGTGASAASIRAEMDANSTRLAAIDAKTTALPTDPADASNVAAAITAAQVVILAAMPTAAPTAASILAAFQADTEWKTMLSSANGDWTFTPPVAYPGTGTLVLKDKDGIATRATFTLTFDANKVITTRASA